MAVLTFWGGVGTVTGSKYHLDSGRSRLLVDCGLFQGRREERERNWHDPPFDVRQLDAVLLTHAHIDHTGWLPRLVKFGYSGPVFCSAATDALLGILLRDSARIQEEDAAYRTRKNLSRHHPALPLFTEDDVERTLALMRPLSVHDPAPITDDLSVTLYNSGHVLGSRFALVRDDIGDGETDRSVLFSGDLGVDNRPILLDVDAPPTCDYVLVESTFGDREHVPEDPKDTLAEIINAAAHRNGTLLIPAFALGRTQEIIYLIRQLEDEKRIPILHVWLDFPMADRVTSAYRQALEDQDADYAAAKALHGHPLATHNMSEATMRDESRRLNEQSGPRIIISGSAMMTGGRVLHHAMRVLPDPDSTLLFVGHQAYGTLGRRIRDGAAEVRIHKQVFPIRCRVQSIGSFPSHADWQDVLDWLGELASPPRRVFLTHGEQDSAEALRDRIQERFGWDVVIPQYGDRYDLV
jgi:metallo-beta-lactamase family protein